MYKSISQQKLVQICTHLYLTRSRYQYVQISPSQEAGTNMYKSLSYKEPVQNMNSTNLSPTGSWYKYVQISLSQEPVQICTSLYLTRSPVPVCTSLSLTGSWYKYVHCTSLYLTRELVPICTLYNSLPHRALVQICTSLNLTRSRYKYVPTVPISLSPEAGLNLYKSLSHRIQ